MDDETTGQTPESRTSRPALSLRRRRRTPTERAWRAAKPRHGATTRDGRRRRHAEPTAGHAGGRRRRARRHRPPQPTPTLMMSRPPKRESSGNAWWIVLVIVLALVAAAAASGTSCSATTATTPAPAPTPTAAGRLGRRLGPHRRHRRRRRRRAERHGLPGDGVRQRLCSPPARRRLAAGERQASSRFTLPSRFDLRRRCPGRSPAS